MRISLLIFTSFFLLKCSNSTIITAEDLVGIQPPPSKSACEYQNNGSIDKALLPTTVLERIIARAKKHCDGLGGVNFEISKFNALERLDPSGNKFILWNEQVFCSCSE